MILIMLDYVSVQENKTFKLTQVLSISTLNIRLTTLPRKDSSFKVDTREK